LKYKQTEKSTVVVEGVAQLQQEQDIQVVVAEVEVAVVVVGELVDVVVGRPCIVVAALAVMGLVRERENNNIQITHKPEIAFAVDVAAFDSTAVVNTYSHL
jgi:hypothetical protein